MAFKVVNTPNSGNSESTVDFDAINRYRVEAAGLQERETVPGYVAAIVDLGIQKQPDAEVEFTGTEEEEEAIMAEMPDTYFKDGVNQDTKQPVRLKCWPQKPQQCVVLAIDFPDIIVDMAQAYGEESKPLPLRLYTGGQFYIPTQGMIVARPTPLRVVNLDKSRKTKKWSLAQNNMLHKMAVAAKLIKPDEVFLPQRIDELLGKAFQFDAQVYMKQSGQKEYFTEYLKFSAALGRGQNVADLETVPTLVEFDEENSDAAVKELRQHVINTIKQAENFKGSAIQKQLEKLRPSKPAKQDEEAGDDDRDEEQEEVKPTPKVAGRKSASKSESVKETFDADVPW
ncbi:hypothetical protein [Pseudomonas sp. P8_250]|uniref:hypothetical protein n=1 Tax=Pseudomonas sp. P8_250 TaxID=3043446 RepID=UPI002A36E395|nr:hypothetical protein [Pseudomonas sp. P8_250]MDX9668686.1 hypothetical protein [Pseudomonas sp. P8_250]